MKISIYEAEKIATYKNKSLKNICGFYSTHILSFARYQHMVNDDLSKKWPCFWEK